MKRETKSESNQKQKDANRKLKGELLKARKKIRVLQTQLKRYTDLDELLLNDFDIEEGIQELNVEPKCPECGEPTFMIPAGIYTIHKCTKCNHKHKE